MKILLVDLYRLIYRATDNSPLAIAVSVIYIMLLNMAVLYGLAMLLPAAKSLHVLFRFPLFLITGLLLTLLNVWIMAPYKNIKKEKKKPAGFWGLIMYTFVALAIFAYSKYGGVFLQ